MTLLPSISSGAVKEHVRPFPLTPAAARVHRFQAYSLATMPRLGWVALWRLLARFPPLLRFREGSSQAMPLLR